MKAFVSLIFIILAGILPIPCDAGQVLSDEEAAGIIMTHFGYPIAVPAQINFREKSVEMLDYLKRAGYIVNSPAQTCCGDLYATTEKGKPYFGDFVKYLSNNNLYVECVYAKKVVKSIEPVLVDRRKKGATVVYIEGMEPNEPVYSEVFRKSQEGSPGTDLNKTQRIKVTLKYDGRGWRVQEKRVFR